MKRNIAIAVGIALSTSQAFGLISRECRKNAIIAAVDKSIEDDTEQAVRGTIGVEDRSDNSPTSMQVVTFGVPAQAPVIPWGNAYYIKVDHVAPGCPVTEIEPGGDGS
ncbi:MAG: hypothetical protein AB7T49_19435 [Oligoflexales bacterium]